MKAAALAACVSGVAFLGVAIHEWNYKHNHPYAYGPAEVIAWGAAAGALLAAAVGYIAWWLDREGPRR